MKASRFILFLSLVVWSWIVPVLQAAGPELSGGFDAANKLYAEGKFAEAVRAYDQSLQAAASSGTASAALFFNAGNAEFKLGQLGRAIASYRRAALLNPRDSEIQGNLDFVRNQVQGASVRPARWQNWISILTLNEGTLLTAAAFWLWLGLWTARQLRPALAPRLRALSLAALLAAVLCGGILAVQATAHFNPPTAVVIAANSLARSGPFDDAQTVFAPHDGAELSVIDYHDDWVQVTDGSGKIGWLPRKLVALLPGA